MAESQDEKLGYHKGALEALINERNELSRLIKIVDSLIETHGQALQQAGIDVQEFIDQLAEEKEKRVKQAQQMQQEKQAQQSQQSGGRQQSSNRRSGGRQDRSQEPSERSTGGRSHGREASGGEDEDDEVEIDSWLED